MKENFVSILDEVNKFTRNMTAGFTEIRTWSQEALTLQAKFKEFLDALEPFVEAVNAAKEDGVDVSELEPHLAQFLDFEQQYTDAGESISNKSAKRKEFSELLISYLARIVTQKKILRRAIKVKATLDAEEAERLAIAEAEHLRLEEERVAEEQRLEEVRLQAEEDERLRLAEEERIRLEEERKLEIAQLEHEERARVEEEERIRLLKAKNKRILEEKQVSRRRYRVYLEKLKQLFEEANRLGEEDIAYQYKGKYNDLIRTQVQSSDETDYEALRQRAQGFCDELELALIDARAANLLAKERRDLIRNITSDITRIKTREVDILAIAEEGIKTTYFDDEANAVLVIYNEGIATKNATLVTYPDKEALNTAEIDDLRIAKDRVAEAYDKVNNYYNTYGPSGIIGTLQETYLAGLNKIVVDSDLWNKIKHEAKLETKDNLSAWVDDKIAKWKKPKIKVWMKKMGLTAVGGHLRVVPLTAYLGTNVHISLYQANIDMDVELSITTAVNTLRDTLLPESNGGYRGLHLTWEYFGQNDGNNPHYFRGTDGFSIKPGVILPGHIDLGDLENNLAGQLNAKMQFYVQKIQELIVERNASLV